MNTLSNLGMLLLCLAPTQKVLAETIPSEYFAGEISPVGTNGIFEIVGDRRIESDNSVSYYFRLWAVDAGADTLVSASEGTTFTCKQIGETYSNSIGKLRIVTCNNPQVGDLTELLVTQSSDNIRCDEYNALDQVCNFGGIDR